MRSEFRPVSVKMIQKEALQIAQDQGINSNNPEESHKFVASRGWLQRFKKRFSLSIRRKTHYQVTRTDEYEAIIKFQKELKNLINTHQYKADAVANMDETPVYYATTC